MALTNVDNRDSRGMPVLVTSDEALRTTNSNVVFPSFLVPVDQNQVTRNYMYNFIGVSIQPAFKRFAAIFNAGPLPASDAYVRANTADEGGYVSYNQTVTLMRDNAIHEDAAIRNNVDCAREGAAQCHHVLTSFGFMADGENFGPLVHMTEHGPGISAEILFYNEGQVIHCQALRGVSRWSMMAQALIAASAANTLDAAELMFDNEEFNSYGSGWNFAAANAVSTYEGVALVFSFTTGNFFYNLLTNTDLSHATNLRGMFSHIMYNLVSGATDHGIRWVTIANGVLHEAIAAYYDRLTVPIPADHEEAPERRFFTPAELETLIVQVARAKAHRENVSLNTKQIWACQGRINRPSRSLRQLFPTGYQWDAFTLTHPVEYEALLHSLGDNATLDQLMGHLANLINSYYQSLERIEQIAELHVDPTLFIPQNMPNDLMAKAILLDYDTWDARNHRGFRSRDAFETFINRSSDLVNDGNNLGSNVSNADVAQWPFWSFIFTHAPKAGGDFPRYQNVDLRRDLEILERFVTNANNFPLIATNQNVVQGLMDFRAAWITLQFEEASNTAISITLLPIIHNILTSINN